MLDDMYVVEDSEIPKSMMDGKMIKLSAELGRQFNAFHLPTKSLRDEIWPACDRAFHCIRDDLPFLPTMRFIDNGMLGESDVRDAIKLARNQILQGSFPSDESWLEPVAMGDDDESVLKKVKDLLINKFEGAGIRDKGQIFLDQYLARGISAMGVRWSTRHAVRSVPREMAKTLRLISKDSGLTDMEGNLLHEKNGRIRYWKKVSDDPIIFPIDMYRLWLDPAASIDKDDDMSYIYLTFKTLTDLKNAKDPQTGENLYDHDALENVTEWEYKDYYANDQWACYSTKFMGIDPGLENMGKFVPVYMFYMQQRDTEDGDIYIDKIFYVARSGGRASSWQIIRVQDNPSAFGDRPFFVANCDAWLNTPYGTGLAEKSLSALKAKNISAAIWLNAMVLNLFPPMYYQGNVLKDDRKPKLQPAAFQEIIARPGIGMDWIKPYPVNPNLVTLGMQDQRYLGEKILSQTGVSSAGLSTDPTKSMSKEKTAAEVHQVANDGVIAQQVIVDKLNNQIWEPLAQCMYNLLRQHGQTGDTSYVSNDATGKPVRQTLKPEELNKDREIKIYGRRGLASKAQAGQSLQECLKILSNPQAAQVINNLPLMLQDILFQLIGSLGVPIKEEYKASADEIFAKEPHVQQAALQNALQNPEMRMQIAQMLLKSPEGQQLIQQIQEQTTSGVLAQQKQLQQMATPPAAPPPVQGAA